MRSIFILNCFFAYHGNDNAYNYNINNLGMLARSAKGRHFSGIVSNKIIKCSKRSHVDQAAIKRAKFSVCFSVIKARHNHTQLKRFGKIPEISW